MTTIKSLHGYRILLLFSLLSIYTIFAYTIYIGVEHGSLKADILSLRMLNAGLVTVLYFIGLHIVNKFEDHLRKHKA